jgi:ABC-2 type transport system permease protein
VNATLAIARRELGSYLRQPAGWIIMALYLFLAGAVFAMNGLSPGKPATLREFFALSGWLLLPVAPAISMRLVAEEIRTGTIEQLLTAPISAWSLVMGKYAGALAFLGIMLAPTLLYPLVLSMYSQPSPAVGPIAAGYLCLGLLGALYLALGLLASCLTNNATLAFMLTLFAILGVLFAPLATDLAPARLQPLIAKAALSGRVLDFARGVIDTSHAVFFIAVSGVLLVLSVAVMEVRRWR